MFFAQNSHAAPLPVALGNCSFPPRLIHASDCLYTIVTGRSLKRLLDYTIETEKLASPAFNLLKALPRKKRHFVKPDANFSFVFVYYNAGLLTTATHEPLFLYFNYSNYILTQSFKCQ